MKSDAKNQGSKDKKNQNMTEAKPPTKPGIEAELKPTDQKPHGLGHYRYKRDWYRLETFDAFKWQEESEHVRVF